ncbi:hypothetical protein [Bradyrhizobium sp. JYMT SZCCT0180]|uniref:hypothetical protein n=1 Tax=Bradyrhizobium sp. JYMT SZCCT0180 TaxID=2807666 RepID=UPI001BAA1156|nr:hypothetical protein [Bradyrhizobium sp. JYMT SZCCT0180]MBR1212973.1 hypothetical protein [Bradyrhizobium sp. JYMT SZCCT0180]
MRQIPHRHLLIGASLLFLLGPVPALSEDTDRLHICIARALPEMEVTIGFTPTVTVNIPRYSTDKSWFQQVKNLFWRIRVPARERLFKAPDRPEITTRLYETVQYPQMVWAAPVNAELRRMQDKPGVGDVPPQGDCLQYADLSPREIRDDQLFIGIGTPTYGPPWQPVRTGDCEDETPVRSATRTPELDFDNFKACRYQQTSLGMAHDVAIRYFGPDKTYPSLSCPVQALDCTMGLNRDGWSFNVSFRKQKLPEWRAIARATAEFVDKVTVSRDDITAARIDPRP